MPEHREVGEWETQGLEGDWSLRSGWDYRPHKPLMANRLLLSEATELWQVQ